MSRLSHLGIGLALCLFSVVCFGVGYVAFIGTAISKDSVPGASVFDGGFIFIYVIFGGLILGALWFALLSFRHAFMAPPRPTRYSPPAVEQKAPLVPSQGTPDENLAHLLKRPE
jgi:hypothetical protein